jgi:hypothetical protein
MYARHGLPVIPVLTLAGKRPAICDWPNRATTDLSLIDAWWRHWPHAGVGVLTGPSSGVLVLDLDTPEAVDHVAQIGLPKTPVVRTPRGWHIWMRYPDGFEHSTTKANVLAVPGGDTRGQGGFITVPPSPHPEGVYEWARSIWTCPLADPPDWLLDALTPPPAPDVPAPEIQCEDRYARAALEGECAEVASMTEGGRNQRLNVAAFKLGRFIAAGTLSVDEVTAALTHAAQQAGLPPIEITKTIASGMQGGMAKGGSHHV